MKKLIHTALIAIALMSTTAYATETTEAAKATKAAEPTKNDISVRTANSYACAIMVERGSSMFC